MNFSLILTGALFLTLTLSMPTWAAPDSKSNSGRAPDEAAILAQADALYGKRTARRALAFIYDYHEAWSASNGAALLSALEGVYADEVEFNGEVISGVDIVLDMRDFAEEWPLRDYSIREGTLKISCDYECNISALVDWFAAGEEKPTHMSGVIAMEWVYFDGKITKEKNTLVQGQLANPADLLARANEQNVLCRGGSVDQIRTWRACAVRGDLGMRLRAIDWCHGREGEASYQMMWHVCEASSLR